MRPSLACIASPRLAIDDARHGQAKTALSALAAPSTAVSNSSVDASCIVAARVAETRKPVQELVSVLHSAERGFISLDASYSGDYQVLVKGSWLS